MRSIFFVLSVMLPLLAGQAEAKIYKDSCDGAATSYANLDSGCAKSPNTILAECREDCARPVPSRESCPEWTRTQTALAACTSAGDKMLLRKCTAKQTEFAAQAIEFARVQAQKLNDSLAALDISEYDVETQRRFGYARKIAGNALNWVNEDRQFLCQKEGQGLCKTSLAWALPWTGGLAAVRLCDGFFDLSLAKAGSVIIHEATHSCCFTLDLQYYNEGPDDQPLSSHMWHNIADTYSYWIDEGLCVPEESECNANAVVLQSPAHGGGGGSW